MIFRQIVRVLLYLTSFKKADIITEINMNIRHCFVLLKGGLWDNLSKYRINKHLRREYCKNVLDNSKLPSVINDDFDSIDSLSEPKISILKPSTENLSDYTKTQLPSYNFAPFVNKSPVLTDMVKLGVELYKIERKEDRFAAILKLNEEDFKKYVTFLCDYVDAEKLGKFITKNPLIFHQRIEDMETRINYLHSKKFSTEMVKSVISKNPYWLNFSTKRIDFRLGWFQKQFSLTGDEVRRLTVRDSRVITYALRHVEVNKFSIFEEMGFEEKECKRIILNHPKLLMLRNRNLLDKFQYIHDTMKMSHTTILNMPQILYTRTSRLRQRHTFLVKMRRAQYDCTQPNYVSPMDIVTGTDAEFCLNVAKCPVTDYNTYLKSL